MLSCRAVATSTRRKTTSTNRRSGTDARPKSGARAPKGKRTAAQSKTEPLLRRALRQTTDGHGADAWGLVLIALGVLLALGTYVGLAGAAGRALDGAVGAVVGAVKR